MRTAQCSTHWRLGGTLHLPSESVLPALSGRIHPETKAARYRRSVFRHKLPTHFPEAVSGAFAQRPGKIRSENLRVQNIWHAGVEVRAQV